jgi:hypothetical protein
MFPPAPADRATAPSIVPFPTLPFVGGGSTGTADRTTRRRLLMGIAAGGLATGAAGALALPGGTQGPAAGTALGDSLAGLAGHSGVDPALVALAAHKAVRDECLTFEGKGLPDDVFDEAHERYDATLKALLLTPPHTTLGIARVLEHVGTHEWCDPDGLSILASASEAGDPVLQQAAKKYLHLLSAAALEMSGVRQSGARPQDDPIFAAIEAHRAAWADYTPKIAALEDVNTRKAEAELLRVYDVQTASECALAAAGLTTIAGAVALLRYVDEFVDRDEVPPVCPAQVADMLEIAAA